MLQSTSAHSPPGLSLLDAQTLLHGVALVPDEDVEGRELLGPLRRQGVHAFPGDAIDVVSEDRPGIRFVAGRTLSHPRKPSSGRTSKSSAQSGDLEIDDPLVERVPARRSRATTRPVCSWLQVLPRLGSPFPIEHIAGFASEELVFHFSSPVVRRGTALAVQDGSGRVPSPERLRGSVAAPKSANLSLLYHV